MADNNHKQEIDTDINEEFGNEEILKKVKKKKEKTASDHGGPSTTFHLHSLMLFGGRLLHKVLNAYNSLFELSPEEKAKIYRNISTHYAKKGLYDKSIESLKDWVKLEPKNPDAHHQLGLAHAACENPKAAIKSFERVLKINPEHKGAIYHRSSLYLKMKKYDIAVEGLEKVSQVSDNPKVYYLLGIAYDGMGEIDKAIEAMTKASELDPEEIKYNQHLGFLNVRKDDHKSAAEYFTKVMELERDIDGEY
uniref:Magnetosome protein MamA n=1 Tax=Candidatus Magnetananas rongchengensis TaxID=1463558 RepID=A0A3Q8BC51_9BACT|nr:magnetosome protein MamA [Candidatus Magnetananas rongchenensis]